MSDRNKGLREALEAILNGWEEFSKQSINSGSPKVRYRAEFAGQFCKEIRAALAAPPESATLIPPIDEFDVEPEGDKKGEKP